MPYYTLPIPEIDESVKRPVVAGVITDLMPLFGISENIPIIFKGVSPQAPYLNSDLFGQYDEGTNRYNADAYLTIEDYTEDENEHSFLSTAVHYPENRGVFLDNDLSVYLVPARYSKMIQVRLSLTGSEKQIERWQANIKRRTAQGLLNAIHTVKYHYPIPGKFMEFLCDAHEMRESVAGYGEDLGTWLNRCFLPTMTVLRATDGTSPIFAIQETQQPIQGWFDFGLGAPKKETSDTLSRYSLNFTYSFYLDVPQTVTLITPLVIHNQLLPYRWLPKHNPLLELDFIRQNGGYSQEAFNYFRYTASANEYTFNARPGLPIPEFDDWVGERPPNGYNAIMRILVRLDESNLNKVMNLQSLGEWALDPLCVRYMKDVRTRLNKPYDSIINIMLHTGDDLLDMAKLSVDENLVVSFDRELDLRKSYHLVVTMCTDPSVLSDVAIGDLLDHGCFFKSWVSTLFEGVEEAFGWDVANCAVGTDDDLMTNDDIKNAIDDVVNDNGVLNDLSKPLWALVGKFTIVARKQSDET